METTLSEATMPASRVGRDDELQYGNCRSKLCHEVLTKAASQNINNFSGVEITFKSKHPKCPIRLEVVCGESIPGWRDFGTFIGDTLLWEANVHLARDAGFDLILKESRVLRCRAKRSFASMHMKAMEIQNDDDRGLLSVKLVFEFPTEAAAVVSKGAKNAIDLLEKKSIALERLGRARKFVEAVKDFGEALADVGPEFEAESDIEFIIPPQVSPLARAVAIAFDTLYEKLKAQKTVHDDALELIEDMQQFLPFTDVVHLAHIQSGAARSAIKEFLITFKAMCDFVVHYSSDGIIGDLVSSHATHIDDLKSNFRKAKHKYDWSIKTEVWKINLKIEKIRDNDLLKPLRVSSLGPSGKEYYRTDKACLSGTRSEVLRRISQWTGSISTSNRKVLWLHGPPGCGKSAIAHSVAHTLDTSGLLAACFLCRRDDLDLRDPSKLVPSLAAHLATWHQPYSIELLSALQNGQGSRLASKTIQEQFDLLIKGPVLAVREEDTQPPNPLVIVVDGLDEIGKTRGQRMQLAKILVQITDVIPWLKLFVTSRPVSELSQVFQASVDKLDLNDLGDPRADILLYANHRTRVVAQENGLDETWMTDDQISTLVEKSQGLFIWIDAVFSFIERHVDVYHALLVALLIPFHDVDHGDDDVRNVCLEYLQKAESRLLDC